MSLPPTDDPDYLDREMARILSRVSEDPGDLRRLLLGLAETLELVAARIPPVKEGDRRLVWTSEDIE